jgi:hypothetical protein
MVEKAKAQPESIIQANVYAYLEKCDEYFGFAVYNGGTYDPRIRCYRANKGPGKRKGVFDLCGMWRGQFLAIEIKTRTGKLSPDQKQFQQDVIAAGGMAIVVRSVAEVIDYVRALRIVGIANLGERNG